MRTAYQVITVATKSSAECAASDSSASEPEKHADHGLGDRQPARGRDRGQRDAFFRLLHQLAVRRRAIAPSPPPLRSSPRGIRAQPRAQLRGARHIVDAADALAGRPHVLPRALLVIEIELLGRRRQVDIRGPRGIDARAAGNCRARR